MVIITISPQSSPKSKETDVGEQCSGGEGEEAIAKKLVNDNIEVLFKIIQNKNMKKPR